MMWSYCYWSHYGVGYRRRMLTICISLYFFVWNEFQTNWIDSDYKTTQDDFSHVHYHVVGVEAHSTLFSSIIPRSVRVERNNDNNRNQKWSLFWKSDITSYHSFAHKQTKFAPYYHDDILQNKAIYDCRGGGEDDKVVNIDNDDDVTLDLWKDIEYGESDSILGIAQAFRSCANPHKVNLCIGAYRDEDGKPWILPSVRIAEERILQEQIKNPSITNKEYLPIEGDMEYIQLALQFAYGKDMNIKKIAGVQTLSGTGACRIGGQFLNDFYHVSKKIYIPKPTWGNHYKVFQANGLETYSYRYYNEDSKTIDLVGLIEDLNQADDGSIILFHACAHNPTGCDPTIKQWEDIIYSISKKKHIVLLDSAYQGFATGDAEKDAATIRMFAKSCYDNRIVGFLLAQSFAKNFGLYGERVGTLSVACRSEQQADIVLSRLKNIIRPMYSSPPKHGSTIIKTVLSDSVLSKQYYQECKLMSDRISDMRHQLILTLKQVGSKLDWSHISSNNQIGMFAYTGMTCEQVDRLILEFSIYMTRDGRISLAGLNPSNMNYVANAIHTVTMAQE